MRAEGSPSLSRFALFPRYLMAGFQTSPNGRFWVFPEVLIELELIRAHSPAAAKLAAGLAEFETYIDNNQDFIPNFGERYRQGETISTAFVESTINQVVSRRFVKKRQMHWTLRGAHLLLQTRTKILNNELEDVFRRWYPQFRPKAA
jgi:hypothetical protein